MHHIENSSEVSPWYLSLLQKALVLEAKRDLFHFSSVYLWANGGTPWSLSFLIG